MKNRWLCNLSIIHFVCGYKTKKTKRCWLKAKAANETATSSKTLPEPTDKAADNSPTETARTYPKHSRNPVDRFEPTW